VSTIPIDVLDEGEFVHHGASPDDIRAVLKELPESARLGISRIQLSLGKAQMEAWAEGGDREQDPLIGRLGSKLFSGVFGGETLGCFMFKSGLVSIYAFVCDWNRIPVPTSFCKFYLRLHALKTFVHEVAHHHDRIARVARGRWRLDRQINGEMYAEQMEHKWTQEVVLPYLRRNYAKEARALLNWVAHRGGLRVDLDFIAGDSRRTERDGLQRIFLSTSGAFENWLDALPTCKTLAESRLALAWELHYSDCYEECLQVLNGILAGTCDWVPALTCKADTLVHLEQHDEALDVSRQVLQLQPSNVDAWKTQGDVFRFRDDWERLLDNCAAWEGSGRMTRRAKRELLMHRAIAHCALDNPREMNAAIEAYLALMPNRTPEIAARRRKYIYARTFRSAGKPIPPEFSTK
jgi:tetratricopeptide (TPR) repeat protein